MRVKLTKPVNGRVSWEVDARQGPTGFHERGDDVLLADLEGQLAASIARYEQRRNAIRAVRRPPHV